VERDLGPTPAFDAWRWANGDLKLPIISIARRRTPTNLKLAKLANNSAVSNARQAWDLLQGKFMTQVPRLAFYAGVQRAAKKICGREVASVQTFTPPGQVGLHLTERYTARLLATSGGSWPAAVAATIDERVICPTAFHCH